MRFFQVIMTKIPAYLEQVLFVPMSLNGYINSAIYIAICVAMTIGGPLSDYLYKRNCCSITTIRKVFQTFCESRNCAVTQLTNDAIAMRTAMMIPAVCLVAIPWVGRNTIAVFMLLIVAMFGNGCSRYHHDYVINN